MIIEVNHRANFHQLQQRIMEPNFHQPEEVFHLFVPLSCTGIGTVSIFRGTRHNQQRQTDSTLTQK